MSNTTKISLYVKLERNNRTRTEWVSVSCAFNDSFVAFAKKNKGKFDRKTKEWIFSASLLDMFLECEKNGEIPFVARKTVKEKKATKAVSSAKRFSNEDARYDHQVDVFGTNPHLSGWDC